MERVSKAAFDSLLDESMEFLQNREAEVLEKLEDLSLEPCSTQGMSLLRFDFGKRRVPL